MAKILKEVKVSKEKSVTIVEEKEPVKEEILTEVEVKDSSELAVVFMEKVDKMILANIEKGRPANLDRSTIQAIVNLLIK